MRLSSKSVAPFKSQAQVNKTMVLLSPLLPGFSISRQLCMLLQRRIPSIRWITFSQRIVQPEIRSQEVGGIFDAVQFENFAKFGQLDKCLTMYRSTPTPTANQLMLKAYLEHDMLAHAKALRIEITNSAILNLWVRYWVQMGQPSLAERILVANRYYADAESYLPFLETALRQGDYARAQELQRRIAVEGHPIPSSYETAVARDLCQKRLSQYRHLLGKQSISDSIRPFLLEALAFEGDLEAVKRIQSPDSLSDFNAILKGMGHRIRDDEMHGLLKALETRHQPDSGTYYAIVRAFLLQDRFQEALDLSLQISLQMETVHLEDLLALAVEKDFDSLVGLLTDLLSLRNVTAQFFNIQLRWLLKRSKFSKIGALLKKMHHKGVYPRMPMIVELVEHCVSVLDLRRARNILDALQSYYEVTPELRNALLTTYHICIRAEEGSFLLRGYPADAQSGNLVNCLDPPREIVWKHDNGRELGISGIKSSFEGIFGLSMQVGTNLFNDLLVGLLRGNRIADFEQMLAEMHRHRLQPNLITMTLSIKTYLQAQHPDKAKQVIEEFKKFGLNPTQMQCAYIHHYYCRRMETENAEAWMLFCQKKYGTRLNLVFYASLVYSYFRGRNFPKIFELRERIQREECIRLDSETANYYLISLFETGNYNQAVEFALYGFQTEGIPKNYHSYTILAEHALARDDWDTFFKFISDADQPGNEINWECLAIGLERADRDGKVDKMKHCVELLINHSIRLDPVIMPYISEVFESELERAEDLNFIRVLVEKSMVDIEGKCFEVEEMQSKLQSFYMKHEMTDELQSFETFKEHRLLILKKIWTELRPDFVESLEKIEDTLRMRLLEINLEEDLILKDDHVEENSLEKGAFVEEKCEEIELENKN